MGEVLTQDRRTAAHYIISEAGSISRETGKYAAGNGKIIPGTLVSSVSDEYVPWNPTASDGSEVPVGIAMYPVDTDSDQKRGTITARQTEVQAEVLVWPEGTTDQQKNDALAELAKHTIIAR